MRLDLLFVTATIGLLGTKPSYQMMTECDTLLMVRSSFPYSEFLPVEGQAHGNQIDIDARMVSIRYPMDVSLVEDSIETQRFLMPLLERKGLARGGYLLSASVEPTLEVLLIESPRHLARTFKPESGLALVDVDA